ncbi:MAG: dihydropteroate synthase [Prevotella sp.]|nr:dihydropteroate synthase [Prevotella sp.]
MNHTINVRGRLVALDKPQVMGILNATPDSFYEGSRKQTERDIAERALQIVDEGGTMIDVGAFSTRPGAIEVSEEEELNRLRFALGIVRRELPDAIVSVDTYRPLVARQCVEEWGADMINDVSEGGLTGIVNTPLKEQYNMFQTIASLRVPYILMSVRSTLREMLLAFAEEIQQLHELGVCDVIIDPGFGFGKTLEQNYQLMKELDKLLVLDLPLLVGVSRKSMIYKLLDGTPSTALNGTTVLHTVALQKGASILRVHDVREAVETIKIVSLL